MSILDKVKGLVTGETKVDDLAGDIIGEVAGNIDIGEILGGLLGGKDLSIGSLGKTLGPIVKQIAGEEGAKQVDTVVGNLTKVKEQGVDEPSIVKSVIDFLQKNNVGLDTIVGLLKKIPIDPADIIKFLGLLTK